MPKFSWATLSNSEVINANLFHFEPIFDHPLKKVVREGVTVPVRGVLIKLGDSLARVRIWGAAPFKGRNIIFRKMRAMVGQH